MTCEACGHPWAWHDRKGCASVKCKCSAPLPSNMQGKRDEFLKRHGVAPATS